MSNKTTIFQQIHDWEQCVKNHILNFNKTREIDDSIFIREKAFTQEFGFPGFDILNTFLINIKDGKSFQCVNGLFYTAIQLIKNDFNFLQKLNIYTHSNLLKIFLRRAITHSSKNYNDKNICEGVSDNDFFRILQSLFFGKSFQHDKKHDVMLKLMPLFPDDIQKKILFKIEESFSFQWLKKPLIIYKLSQKNIIACCCIIFSKKIVRTRTISNLFFTCLKNGLIL